MSGNKKDQERNAEAYKAYAKAKPTNLTPPISYGNANTDGPLKANCMSSPRVEANDNLMYASRDSGAQIVRCI